jgi:hypothetical protein
MKISEPEGEFLIKTCQLTKNTNYTVDIITGTGKTGKNRSK